MQLARGCSPCSRPPPPWCPALRAKAGTTTRCRRSTPPLLLIIITLPELIERQPSRPFGSATTASRLLAACVLILFCSWMVSGWRRSRPDHVRRGVTCTGSSTVMSKTPGNQRALVLSAGMSPQYPPMNYADFTHDYAVHVAVGPAQASYEQCDGREPSFRPIESSRSRAVRLRKGGRGLHRAKPQLSVWTATTPCSICQKKNFDT